MRPLLNLAQFFIVANWPSFLVPEFGKVFSFLTGTAWRDLRRVKSGREEKASITRKSAGPRLMANFRKFVACVRTTRSFRGWSRSGCIIIGELRKETGLLTRWW